MTTLSLDQVISIVYTNITSNQCSYNVTSSPGDMKVMQFKTLTGQKVLDLQGHNGDVAALSLNPKDVNTFITGSVDRTARMWDLRTPGCVQTFWGHKADVNSVSVHPSGVSFVTCSEDKTVSQHQIIYTCS